MEPSAGQGNLLRHIPKCKEIIAIEMDQHNCKVLKEKGYNPVNQLVGYIISGDPSYITSYNGARALLRKLERDEILEELFKEYLKDK